MKYIGFWCAVVLTGWFGESAAQAAQGTYHTVKSGNGQTFLFAQAAAGGPVYTDVYFRIGPAYETDSLSGASMLLVRAIDAQVGAALAGRSARYYSEVSPTQFAFHFESATVDEVLPVIRDQIIDVRITEPAAQAARDRVGADVDSLQHDARAKVQREIISRLWATDMRKLDIYGDRATYKKISADQIRDFHDRYFLPSNNTITVTGSFAEQAVVDKLQTAFKGFRRIEFNPELITHVIDFKPSVYSVQLLAHTPGSHRISVTYQQPGARQDRQGTYSAYLLSSLLNDPQTRAARLLAASGTLINVKAIYDCNNFQGTFTLSADVPDGQYEKAFRTVDSAVQAFSSKDFFTQQDLDAQHSRITREFDELRSQTHTFMTQVARYRFTGDENYFSSLADSILAVDVSAMRRYIPDYFIEHPGVKCVYTDTAALSSMPAANRYYAINEQVKDITFYYPLNITDIDSNGYGDLQRLIEWLQSNADVHVQVNGFSDKGEYDRANDTAVMNFIWNTPTFRKAMPQQGKVHALRPEMMRAMKIMKAIYEAGITDDRITGTSMSFSSDDDQQAAANRKCTVTLEKIRPHISLYEYHFGRKKE